MVTTLVGRLVFYGAVAAAGYLLVGWLAELWLDAFRGTYLGLGAAVAVALALWLRDWREERRRLAHREAELVREVLRKQRSEPGEVLARR